MRREVCDNRHGLFWAIEHVGLKQIDDGFILGEEDRSFANYARKVVPTGSLVLPISDHLGLRGL